MSKKLDRQHLTAITIVAGIITLIERDGTLGYYRQRGITNLPKDQMQMYMMSGALNPSWGSFKELPRNYSITFENERVMGKAYATFKVR